MRIDRDLHDRSAALPVPPASMDVALSRLQALLPDIAAQAAEAEAVRCIPAGTLKALFDAGLFRVMTPRVYGGTQLGFEATARITADIGSACGSTSWLYGLMAGHHWMTCLFPRRAQEEVFGDPNALIATVLQLAGSCTRTDGGYRIVDGAGRFCSGIDFVRWVIVGITARSANGAGEPRFFLVPVEEIEVVDDWHTFGMRATGSRSIRIADAFVPEYRSLIIADVMSGRRDETALPFGSAIYTAPFTVALPLSLVGTLLGIARGALRAFTAHAHDKLAGAPDTGLANHNTTFERIAQAAVDIDAASQFIFATCAELDAPAQSGPLTPVQQARMQRDTAHAAQLCRRAVCTLFDSVGGSKVYEDSLLQRHWRDINAACSHPAFSWEIAARAYGRASLGLPAGTFGAR